MTSIILSKKDIKNFRITKSEHKRTHFVLENKKTGIKIRLMFRQIVFLFIEDERFIFYNSRDIKTIKREFKSIKRKF
jgi:hypothetical protein